MHPHDQTLELMKPKGEGRKDVFICPKSSKENIAEIMHTIDDWVYNTQLIDDL